MKSRNGKRNPEEGPEDVVQSKAGPLGRIKL